jgi:hypothetical protein
MIYYCDIAMKQFSSGFHNHRALTGQRLDHLFSVAFVVIVDITAVNSRILPQISGDGYLWYASVFIDYSAMFTSLLIFGFAINGLVCY